MAAGSSWLGRAWRAFARASGFGAATQYGAQVWLLALGTVVSYLGRGAAIPFVVLYLTQVADIRLEWIGIGIVAEQATRALASPAFGAMSDRYGRKPFMIGGAILQGLAFPAYLLVDDVPTFLAISVLAGLGQAPYQPALSAFLADVTPAHQRVGVFGLVHTTKNLGWGLGVVMGGLLITRSFSLLFLVGGALPILYALLIALFVRESVERRREKPKGAAGGAGASPARVGNPLRMLVSDGRFAAFIALATLIFLTWGQLNSVLPLFLTEGLHLDPLWITRAFALNSALILVLQVPISHRVARWSRTRGLALAAAITLLGYLVLGATPRLWHADPSLMHAGLFVAVTLLTLAEMVETPLTFTLAAELAPTGGRGGAMGVLALAAPIGMGSAALLAGLVTDALAWAWVWYVFAALVLAQVVGFLLLGRRLSPAQDRPPHVAPVEAEPVPAPAAT